MLEIFFHHSSQLFPPGIKGQNRSQAFKGWLAAAWLSTLTGTCGIRHEHVATEAKALVASMRVHTSVLAWPGLLSTLIHICRGQLEHRKGYLSRETSTRGTELASLDPTHGFGDTGQWLSSSPSSWKGWWGCGANGMMVHCWRECSGFNHSGKLVESTNSREETYLRPSSFTPRCLPIRNMDIAHPKTPSGRMHANFYTHAMEHYTAMRLNKLQLQASGWSSRTWYWVGEAKHNVYIKKQA